MKSLLTLVGMKHHPPALRALSIAPDGTELLLVREPANKYDPNAIQVVMILGYIKKERALALAPRMDASCWSRHGEVSNPITPTLAAKLVRNEGTYVELEIEEPEAGPRFPLNSTGIEEMPDPILK